MTTLGVYNDYIWPLVTISDSSLQAFTVGVTRFSGEFNSSSCSPLECAPSCKA